MSFYEKEAFRPQFKKLAMKSTKERRRLSGTRPSRLPGFLRGLAVCCAFSFALPALADRQPCSVGLITPGYTVPIGDIALLYGTPLDVQCVLHLDQTHGYNASHLRFYKGSDEIESKYISVVNESVSRLHIDEPAMSDTMYHCKLLKSDGDTVAVCLNHVTVGTLPQEVTDFKCLSKDWNNLTCTWTPAPNYLLTTYSLSFKLHGRASRGTVYSCPDDKPKYEREHDTYSCFWNHSTIPLYRQAYPYYYFNLTASNKYGVKSQSYEFNHFARTKPSAPIFFQAVNKTTHSVLLKWNISSHMKNFPKGLVYRFKYLSEFQPERTEFKEHEEKPMIVKSRLFYNLTGLPYANALYDMRIYVKSELATAEEFWSDFASLTVRTLSKLPDRPPETEEGIFEVIPSLESRDVIIYWKQIERYEENGENFHYKVSLEIDGSPVPLYPNTSDRAYLTLKKLPWKELKFSIRSWNSVGGSLESSQIIVPARENMLPEPVSFTKIAYDETTYELSWNPPMLRRGHIDSYSIFWCDNARDRPFQCEGRLQWKKISAADSKILNVTLNDDKIYQFAISANGGGGSSGMVWASCTVIPTKLVGKMKNIWINKVGASFIEVGWRLECSDRIGVIKGYRLFYCPITSPHNKDCRESVRNVTADSQAIRTNITDLKPYTTYAVRIAVITTHGDGLQSDSLSNTTLEGAPSPPLGVQISDLGNNGMLVTWKPPTYMNGVIRFYLVNYDKDIDNLRHMKVDSSEPYLEVTIRNLTGYTNYTVSVQACTVMCSMASEPRYLRTAVGAPGRPPQPTVSFSNSSQVALVSWKPPALAGGTLDFYEIRVVEKAEDGKNVTRVYNTTAEEFIVPEPVCRVEGIASYAYSVRAANLDSSEDHGAASFSGNSITVSRRPADDFNVLRYVGPWSDNFVSICTKATTNRKTALWGVGTVLGVLFAVLVYWLSKRLWLKCKRMQDIGVSLPPGMEPCGEKDSKDPLRDRWESQVKHSKGHDKFYLTPSADEVSLLHGKTQRSDALNKTACDMSGFSVNTDSTTLTVSSEEEKDRIARDGSQSGPPSADSSLRLRNISSGSRPASAGSSEAPTLNSPYTGRNFSQDDDVGMAPYSAVGAWTPDDYFSKGDSNRSNEVPKGYVSFGMYGVDNSLNSGLTPPGDSSYPVVAFESPVSNRDNINHGYVAVANLPVNKSPKITVSPRGKIDTPATELPSGYVKTAPDMIQAPAASREPPMYVRGAPANSNPSGYVSVDDAMLIAKPTQFPLRMDGETPSEISCVRADDAKPPNSLHLPGIMPIMEDVGYVKPGNPTASKRISVPLVVNDKALLSDNRFSLDCDKSPSLLPFKRSTTNLDAVTPVDSPEAYCRFGWNNPVRRHFEPLKMGEVGDDDLDISSFQDMMMEESPLPEAAPPAAHYQPLNLPAGRH